MSILNIQESKIISVKDLKEAICLKCANCYGAMSFANALGGSRTDAWFLCHTYTLKQLLEEARQQNLDLSGLKCAVENQPIEETLYYKRASGLITEQEFKTAFSKWQKGEK